MIHIAKEGKPLLNGLNLYCNKSFIGLTIRYGKFGEYYISMLFSRRKKKFLFNKWKHIDVEELFYE